MELILKLDLDNNAFHHRNDDLVNNLRDICRGLSEDILDASHCEIKAHKNILVNGKKVGTLDIN